MLHPEDLITTAYPDFDAEYDNPENYYLLRLGSLWGDEIITECITAMEEDISVKSTQVNLPLNTPLESMVA